MKKLLTSATIAILMVFAFQSSNAQTANFSTKTARTVMTNDRVSITCDMEQLGSEADAKALASKLHIKGIYSVDVVGYAANKAQFVFVGPKKGVMKSMQKAFIGSGIETLYLDGKPVKTAEIFNVLKSTRTKAKATNK